jgi:thiamine pyrophosphokinase
MEDGTVVVVAGGDPPRHDAALGVPLAAPVIAADGGLENATALGLDVTTAIGDFDSVAPDALARAASAGAQVVRHPEAKDATDLELALDAALDLRPERVLVLSGGGGRLDHLLATLLLLASPRYESVQLDAEVGTASVHVIRGERALHGKPGQLVSLLPLHGSAEGVSTQGLEYPLSGERLDPGSSRGVSNVFVAETAVVHVERGVLVAVLPGPEEEDAA